MMNNDEQKTQYFKDKLDELLKAKQDTPSTNYSEKLKELLRLKAEEKMSRYGDLIKSTYNADTKTLKWVCPKCNAEYSVVHTGERDIQKYPNDFRTCSKCGTEYVVMVDRRVMSEVFNQMIRKIHECGDPFG
jgi:uncharacterized protein with PIN domain